MPLNEYDDILKGSENEYDDILKSESQSQAQQVNSAMYVAADKQPDRHAQVLDLAKKTKLPADIVDRNFDEISKKNQINSIDYPDLIDKTPGLAKWLESPDNMAVAKDDLDNLKSIESKMNDSWLSKAVDSIKYGSVRMMADIAKSPALMAFSDPTPYFLEGTSVGEEIKKEAYGSGEKRVPESFYKNKATAYLDEKAESYKPESLSKSTVEQWSSGDYSGAAETWSLNIMSNLPQLGLLIATQGRSLPLLGLQSAGGKIADNLEAGVPIEKARESALLHAGIEVGVESIGGIGASGFKESIKTLVESVGEQGAKEIIKGSAKKMLKTGFEEGAEEWITELAQSTVDYGLGINDKAFDGLGVRAMDSFLIGAGSGAMATGGALALENTVKQFQKDKKIDMHKDAYLKIGEIAEQSRLKKRSKDKFKEFLETSTENTELKNVYIPVEQFSEYFQNSKIPPAKMAQDLGVLDAFNRASETGGDVEIPLAQFVDKMSGTEHYQALANDVKFSPDGQTPNQSKAESQKVSADMQRIAIEGQQEPLIKTPDQSAKVVQNNVKAQLKDAGFKDAEATRNAELYYAAFGTLASKSGQTAETLFNKYGLKIESMESPTTTSETAMNQSPRLEGQAAVDYLAKEMSTKTPDEAMAEYFTDKTSGVYNDLAFNSQPINPEKPMTAQISVEGVKYLNDTLGHGAADDLYKYVGQALQRVAPDVAKVGGDFALRVKDEAELQSIIEKVKEVMPAKIKLGNKVVNSNSFDLSAALGMDLTEASQKNIQGKQALENEGKRAKRGEMPLRYSEAQGFADSINFTPTPISKELRANYEALTPEQRLNDMYIDKKSGFLTYEAYSKLPKKQFRASIDIDGLKAVNDLYGSQNGDKMLDAFNKIVKHTLGEYGLDIDMTHKSGDEYLAQFDSGETLSEFFKEVERKLGYAVIKMPLADGTVKDFVGITFGAGIGSTDEIAERLLGKRKAEKRKRAGDVARSDRSGENIAKGRDRRVNRPSGSGVLYDPTIAKPTEEKTKPSLDNKKLFQNADDPRGRIRFGKDRQFSIDLFKSKDKSTFLHESAHFLFEVMGDLAQDVDTSQTLKDDYAKLLQWLGVESREQIGVEHHERIARAFEAYLMEGKAPTSSLRKAFNTFKVWLTSIYKKVPPEQISNDVRQVFDRILATDEQIAAANAEMNYKPLIENPKSAGLNDAAAAKYIEATEEARLHSEDHIRSKLMKDYLRQKEKWWKDKKAELSTEIKAELEKTNIYKAIHTLTNTTEAGDLKISKQSVINNYGKEFLKKLPRGVTSDEGVHIDLAAELLNFESGDALITQLANTPKLEAAVEIQANQRMNELYPDLLTSDTLPDEAVQAVHNDSRALVHRLEWQFIADKYSSTMKDAIKRVARPLPTQKIVREQADKIVQSLKVSELRPVVYQRAEIKQHTKAGELLAKGDLLGAMEAKRLALLNHEIYRSVVAAQESVEKDVKKFKKLFKTDEDLSKSRDIDMVNAARAVLAEFGITRADKSASEYLAPMKSYDPEAYESVMSLVNTATDNAGNYKTIKYQDFVNMSEAVSAIWDLSKSSKEIEIDGKRVNSEQIKNELVATIQESVKPGAKGDEFKKTHSDWEKTKIGLLGLKSKLRRVEAFAYGIDGANKAFTRYVFQPVKEAITRYRLEKDQAMRKFQAAAMLLDKSTLTDKKIPANEIGFVFKNKTELLGAMLHTGNDSNLSKLLRGRNWGEAREDGSLDRVKWDKFVNRMQQEGVLTKSDYDFMQATWNLMEELKPAAQKAHKLINGYYFNEVTANEFITPWGSYKGGYIPAKADVFDSIAGALRADKEAIESGQNSYAFPTTGSGSTKSRVEAYATPLNLDVNLVAGHIDWVLRFSHVEPRVKEVAKIINNEGFRQELAELDPTLASEMFIPWLQRAASQRVTEASGTGPGSRQMDKFLTALRSRTGMSIMVGNLTNALQQLTGLSVAAVKVSPHRLAYALVNYAKSPFRVADEISDRSDFMKTQLKQSAMESQDAIDDIMLNPSAWDNSKSFISKHGYFLQTSFQNVVNITTWSAAYDQAIAKDLSEADAVREADSAVRLTQGTLSPEDISSFEAGTPLKRLFTQFGGYFNMLGNLFESEYVNTMKNMGLRKGAGKLAYVYAMGFMLPSVMAELIVQGMSGKGLDADDDDEYLDDMFMIFFGSQLRTAAALFPIVGPAANTVVNTFNGKPYDDRLSTSPAIAALENAVHAPKSVYDAIHSKNKENRAVTDVLTLLSLTSGIPMAPLAKPIRYSNDVSSRKARPTGPIDYGRGLVTGKSGEPDKR